MFMLVQFSPPLTSESGPFIVAPHKSFKIVIFLLMKPTPVAGMVPKAKSISPQMEPEISKKG